MRGDNGTVFRMNYERLIAHSMPRSGVVPLFSGSTINRQHNEKKRKERARREAEVYEKSELQKRIESEKKPRVPRVTYKLSKASGKKIRNKCAAFFSSCARAFVTLTFIENCDDKKALLCLKQMLHAWRKDFGKNFNYIWVAERQKNGRVHFHIMVSEKMNIPKMNTRWIRIQYNAGLKFRDEKHKITFEREHIEAWEKAGRLQEKLNPFDVEYINNQSHLSYYLTKYVTKTANNEDKATFDFLPWSCSHRVGAFVTETIIIPELFFDATTERNSVVVKKQFVRKRTGEVVEPGTVIFPTVHKNDWAISIAILNRQYYHSWLWDMNALNKRIARGERPAVVEYDADHYHNEYVRTFTSEEFDQLGMKYGGHSIDLNGNLIYMSNREANENEFYGMDDNLIKIMSKEVDTAGNFIT